MFEVSLLAVRYPYVVFIYICKSCDTVEGSRKDAKELKGFQEVENIQDMKKKGLFTL